MNNIEKTLTFIFTIFMVFSVKANAELGGDESSVENTRQNLGAVRLNSKSQNQYTIYESTYAGTKIREYAANGKVFAVAWNGLTHPDPSKILGSYYASYKISNQGQPETSRVKGSRSYSVSTGSMTLEKGGHMRNVFGRAYDQALFPVNFSLDDLK